jgi:hypothetical protein
MLTPIQEQAVTLYGLGKDLREVAGALNRSHEWVRKTLAVAGVPTRGRGRGAADRSACLTCGKICQTLRAQFCSRECLHKNRYENAMLRVNVALGVLRTGGSYAAAAEKAGFSSGWHLWGRLYHFGLTDGLKVPAGTPPDDLNTGEDTEIEDAPKKRRAKKTGKTEEAVPTS